MWYSVLAAKTLMIRGEGDGLAMTDAEIRGIIAERVEQVRIRIGAASRRAGRDVGEVTLVAVTKTVTPRVARLLPDLGVLDLGESRPQELWRKAEALSQLPIRWHLIGHLQRNKVGRTLPLAHVIHSVDSLRLLAEIGQQGEQNQRRPRVLLQVNVSRELQKQGFEFAELLAAESQIATQAVDVVGLMGMAALADEPERSRPAFAELRRIRDRLRTEWPRIGSRLVELSMGMSGDFEVAIEEGATLVRIGTTIFDGLEAE
jgi:hypothetical protein